MKKILCLNDIKTSTEFIEILKDKTLVIYEDIQGSKVYVNFSDGEFHIKPKSLSNPELNIIDLTIQKYYQSLYDMLNSLPDRIKELFPKNWWFCYEYFPDEQPANIRYDRKPKNGLVLIGIVKEESIRNKKWTIRWDELKEWADLLDTDVLPIIFKGILNEHAINEIFRFTNTSVDELEFIFGESNFAKFFYNLLSPDESNSFLMCDKYQENLEKLIISILETNNIISFQLLNPLYQKICPSHTNDYVEIYSLILLNFMEWIQRQKLSIIKIDGTTVYDLYLDLMCKLWNKWVDDYLDDILNMKIEVPKFFKEEKFKVNISNIKNASTRNLLLQNDKYEYFFKVIVGTFFKHRNKEIGLFTKQTLNVFNGIVDEILLLINNHLHVMSTKDLKKKGFLVFDDFVNDELTYDIDTYDLFSK
jgi:hypothetical protein